ncbi:unnamed protein product [Acanthoscelides obtectus]|uniref:Protein HGH1 homolog n=1 Tax=Acanthoscelides obtectus TaxID=200917 RepID=A0A9P0MJD6_ACAOB|nr:unnamed protein product [Acanthoscelides obtectus]CAK1684353.1 Protein HGH1 homolog [Acanthoscelides obtectus]
MCESLKELTKFLELGARSDLKAVAVDHILGLTANKDGLKNIISEPQILSSLIALLDDKFKPVSKAASLALINITADEKGALDTYNIDLEKYCPKLQSAPQNIVIQTLNKALDPECPIADECCMILSNLSRFPHLAEKIIDMIEMNGRSFDEIINVFTKTQYNKHGCKLHYLGPFLANLSQSHSVRKLILDKDRCVIQRLLPFTEHENSVRRRGVAGTLKNCCFEEDFHEWLLGEDVDILPRLLLPLAGNEEFDEEDNEKLPLDLQYLPEDKKREGDPEIRCILLEAITQLVAKRPNREFIRDKNTYVIMRELHKWEKDDEAKAACENLVDILIRTEEEIGHENLKEVDIPDDLREKFDKVLCSQ